ncbi:amidohydrolase family protein [Actinomadura rayongensis]|uniref:Amidohydrolase family protein n=2 Tax=Actinomadura rayongensis TaxID=1429076 RepID=A0A6I4W8T0_9ACTN|nr:amidohydrolase family protein [Actinomadura rayongensis]
MEKMTDILSDVTVFTDGRWQDHRDIHITDGIVTGIHPSVSRGDVTRHVIPGFVNTHTHLQQSLMRGMAENTGLLEWLRLIGTETVQITPERAYLATVAASLELLRSGTTTVVEHMWPTPSSAVHEAVIRGLNDTGIRAVLGRGIADRADASRRWGFEPALLSPIDDVLAHVAGLIELTADSRISPALAVPNPRSITKEGLAATRAFAESHAVPVMIHLLETITDDVMCHEHLGMSAVKFLEAADFLWPQLLAVHCVELDSYGQDILAERGVAVAYNPVCNMRLGSGVAPVVSMMERGIKVGLGVDGAASNDTQDMFQAFRIGAYLQRVANKRADILTFPEMIDIACGGANENLGLPAVVGGVSVGAPADLTVIQFDRDYATLPVRDPGAMILTAGSAAIVDRVLVDGEVVYRDGKSTRVDEEELIEGLSRLTT